MRVATRALLAVMLLAGVYVLAAAIALGMVWFGSWYRGIALDAGVSNPVATSFLVVTVLAAGVLLLGMFVRPLLATRSASVVLLPEERHPALWKELRSLAELVGTRPPDEVRLVPAVQAAVTEDSTWLGMVRGKRTLYLGAPLLLGFTRQQLRAVLAHELGHYSRRHTSLGGIAYRGEEALDNLVLRFGNRSVIGKVFLLYARVYTRVSFAVRRQQELEADDFSVRAAGRDAAAGALSEISVLHAAWEHYFEHFVGPVHAAGKRPSDFFAGFTQVLGAPRLQEALSTFRTDFDEPKATTFDSHPPLSQRVARFQSLPDDHVPDDGARAIDVVDLADEALRDLEDWMYQDTTLEVLPWARLLGGIDNPETRRLAEVFYLAAHDQEHSEIRLQTVVDSVRGRRLASYTRPLLENPSGEHLQKASRDLLNSAVDEALMSMCGALTALAWDAPPRLVDGHGNCLDSAAIVEKAIESGDPSVLGDWLSDQGADLDYLPTFPEIDVRVGMRSAPPRVLEGLAPVGGRRTLYCLVLTHGVLLRRGRAGDRLAWLTGGTDPGLLLLRRVFSQDPRELLAEVGNTWLPWDNIASVALGRGRTRRPLIRFVTTDGTTHSVKFRMHTRDTGQTIGALKLFLEDRVAD